MEKGTRKNERFEEIEHTADVAIRVWGGSLAELFVNAAHGLAHQLAVLDGVSQEIEHAIQLEAYDTETLLVSWLSELLYLGERDECVFVAFDVEEIGPTHLRATVRGGAVREHGRHIKAVTFSGLEVRETAGRYETTVVFDV